MKMGLLPLHWAALSSGKPAWQVAGTGRASRVTQHRALGRDPDPPLLCISDGEVSGKAGQDPPSLQTITDIQRQRRNSFPGTT